MSYIFIECVGEAHKDMLKHIDEYLDDCNGTKGFRRYISCHDKDDFIESVADALKEKK
jgi:hypothetical protein